MITSPFRALPRPLLLGCLWQILLGLTAPAVTFNLAGDWLAESDGRQGIPNGALIVLLASTRDSHFDPPSTQGLVDPASDDVILGTFAASDDGGRSNRGSFAASVQVNFGDASQGLEDFDAGDPLLVRWFPTLGTASLSTKLQGHIPYGEFRSEEILLGSNAAWITPGSNAAIINLSIVAGTDGNRYNPQGTLDPDQLAANQIWERAILDVARAQLNVVALGSGVISLSWPLIEGFDSALRIQESMDLVTWSDVTESLVIREDGDLASTVITPANQDNEPRFYRLAAP